MGRGDESLFATSGLHYQVCLFFVVAFLLYCLKLLL